MSTAVEETRVEKVPREPRIRHILNEETGMSECGLARPHPDGPFYTREETDPRQICVVCEDILWNA